MTRFSTRTVLPALAAVLVFGVAPFPALASTPAQESQQPATPNSCIELNHGDFNACDVGTSGRGDLPYQRTARAEHPVDAAGG
jgi:invasion protein IalB